MNNEFLLLTIFGLAFLCYTIEKRIAWISHISGICLLILLAMVLSQFGLVPADSEIYNALQGPLVLVAIVLITLGLQLSDVIKLPIKMIVIFLIGVLGTFIGGLVAGYIGSKSLGINAYQLAAQLTASYIGGGENAAAMQKVFNIPHHYFVSVFAVDNIVTSLWMIFSIWYGDDKEKDTTIKHHDGSNFDGTNTTITSILGCLFISLAIVMLANYTAKHIGLLHPVLWMSIFAIITGQIPMLKEHLKSGYLIGTVIFSGFFFSIGASSDLRAVFHLPSLIIAMPFIIVFIHGVIMISAAYFLNISKISTMVISQALIGGPATAVSVAIARKWKNGISLGIILGILGYAIANFFGVFVYNILQYFFPR